MDGSGLEKEGMEINRAEEKDSDKRDNFADAIVTRTKMDLTIFQSVYGL